MKEFAILLFIIAGIFIWRSIKVVPQQNAWVVERLGKYHAALAPGLNWLVPFVDKVAYKHSLKEIPLDVPRSASRATTPSCRWTASCTSR
jgi:regulator of protease activity HflC (stomatin/prohibitin superfamily)